MSLAAFFLVGCFVAFVATLIASYQERREGSVAESPVVLMGAMFLLSVVMFASKLNAAYGTDPCSQYEPYSFLWFFIGCLWN